MTELVAGVFQAEHEQEEDDADLRADVDELFGAFEREKAAVAEGESAEEIEGDGGEAESVGESGEKGKAKDGSSCPRQIVAEDCREL